jgi:hypothetical protein
MGKKVTIVSDSNSAVVIEGEQNGGVVFAGAINTNGATVIMNSTGNVHHGSGTQINISSKKKS